MKKFTLIGLGLFLSPVTHASGLYFYEIGTEDTALAGAGQAARAQDASTIFTNPAGMTRLPDHMFTGGVQLMDGDISYTLDNESGRQSPGDIMSVFPNASGFYTQKINDDLFAGIGMYGNYGLATDYGDWAGDRLIKKSAMFALTLSPSLAWKLNDRVSVGGSVNVNYGFLSLTRNVDGDDETEKDHDWAMSYRLGLLMELTDQTRAGITWTSKTEYDFDIDAKARFPNLPNVEYDLPLSAQVRAPQQIMISLVHDLNQTWSVMGDLGWQDWSQFGSPQITVVGQDLDKKNRLKDSWHTALGVQYRPTEQWRINAGVAFDSTIYESQNDVSLALPTGDEWRFATGAQYQMTPQSNIGFAVSYLHMQSSRVQSPAILKGSYDDPYLWFASLNYSYQF
ncbi:fatty acid transporter [Salmonella enterica subsp. enterica serovar Miami]|uniref:Fatty acid transporter n=1 Tax=Salmonella enterica TaxID=28901 RepID=A0A639X7U3_SALER|nr:outer membrane protein transport protein [Salmonella enterica]EBV0974472.1 fatty acid transporter [Salmonella enterica subsp. enterica serovar Miami]ECT4849282.1 fatty acid transporter [Salmonella enterica subsp. enterica serovar Saintpaul]ECU4133351.1 fatty acid transporter [Salmonella enterica subsp. enterica serovar Thompson]EDX5655444.1 fatty acid transporter [Salmonella enterica subsp. enterica serovar Mississippi]EEA7805691.1 fatty acid transporter [Salmonella enterica subsp. enterica